MRTAWDPTDLRAVHVKKSQVNKANKSIFELAALRDQLESEYMRNVARLINMEGAQLLEGHWVCSGSPTEQCIFEIKAETDEHCLFCGQSLMR